MGALAYRPGLRFPHSFSAMVVDIERLRDHRSLIQDSFMQPVHMQPSQMQSSIGAQIGDLYNANLALCLRLNELTQIGGQEWVESGTRLVEYAVAESAADLARLARHEPGSSTTAATNDVVRSGFKRWTVHVQAARSMAFEQERSLSTGLREAMTTWGRAVNGSLARADSVTPFADAWVAELTKWTQAWPVTGKAQ